MLRAGCGEPFPAPRPAARSAPERPGGTAEAPRGFWGLNLETRAGGLKSLVLPDGCCSQLPAPGYLPSKRQHPYKRGLGKLRSFLDVLSTHGAAERDSSPSSPFVDLEEQPEGGLRHCTPSCKAPSIMVSQWWQGTSQAPAQHPPKPVMLHQHKHWFLLTIYEKQVPTGGSNSAIKCKPVSPLHTPEQQLAPAFHAGFHQTLHLSIKISSQGWSKALAGSRQDAPLVGSTTSTGCSARHSLHQPSSDTGRVEVSPWYRPETKLRMAEYFLFELSWFCHLSPLQKSGPEDFGCISHLAATVGAAEDLRAVASGRSTRGCSGHAGDLVSICLL